MEHSFKLEIEIKKISRRCSRSPDSAGLVITRCCFAEDAEKSTKIFNARKQSSFVSQSLQQ